MYDFKGSLLREEVVDRFKQFAWRPRPPTLLSKEEQKTIRKNLREYSKIFDEQDLAKKNTANKAVIEHRRRLLSEWRAWRETTEEELRAARRDYGLPEDGVVVEGEKEGDEEVVEEMVEEIIDEKEEVV